MNEKINTLLGDLVRFRSVTSDRVECDRIIDFVEDRFRNTSYVVRRFVSNGVSSLVVSTKTSLEFSLLFFGHLDVVSGADELFSPRIEGEWMYGRGTIDMKGGCAAMMQLFLDREADPTFKDFGLIFTTDEERGGFDGIRYLVQDEGLRADVVFNPDGPADGTGLTPCISEKGILQARLFVDGKTAHGSEPWLGVNAVDLLLKDLGRIREHFSKATGENDRDISFNLGQISGGEALNSVPDLAEAGIDIRFPGRFLLESVRSELSSLCEHARLEIVLEAEAVEIHEQNESLQKLLGALEAGGFPRSTTSENGGSDARWFTQQGSDILIMIPEGTPFHVENEGVNLRSLSEFYRVLARFAGAFS